MRWARKPEEVVGVDPSDGRRNRFDEEVTRAPLDVKSIAIEVKFTDERLGKSRPELLRDDVRGVVEGEDVGIGRGKEGRGFKDDYVFCGDEFF